MFTFVPQKKVVADIDLRIFSKKKILGFCKFQKVAFCSTKLLSKALEFLKKFADP